MQNGYFTIFNIDCLRKCIVPNLNPFPVTGRCNFHINPIKIRLSLSWLKMLVYSRNTITRHPRVKFSRIDWSHTIVALLHKRRKQIPGQLAFNDICKQSFQCYTISFTPSKLCLAKQDFKKFKASSITESLDVTQISKQASCWELENYLILQVTNMYKACCSSLIAHCRNVRALERVSYVDY